MAKSAEPANRPQPGCRLPAARLRQRARFQPACGSTLWRYAPKGTPKEAIDKLVMALQAALKNIDVNKRFAELGATAYPLDKATPAALGAPLRAEIHKWGPIIKKAGVYAD